MPRHALRDSKGRFMSGGGKPANARITKRSDYALGEKRLALPFADFQKSIEKNSPGAQERYWRSWQQYRKDNQKASEGYWVVFEVKAMVRGEMKTYAKGILTNRPHLTKREIEMARKQIIENAESYVEVISVSKDSVASWDYYTGERV